MFTQKFCGHFSWANGTILLKKNMPHQTIRTSTNTNSSPSYNFWLSNIRMTELLEIAKRMEPILIFSTQNICSICLVQHFETYLRWRSSTVVAAGTWSTLCSYILRLNGTFCLHGLLHFSIRHRIGWSACVFVSVYVCVC